MLQYNGRALLYRAKKNGWTCCYFSPVLRFEYNASHNDTNTYFLRFLCWIPVNICWPSSSNGLNHCDFFHPVSGVSEGTFWWSDSTAPLQRNTELKWPMSHSEFRKGCYRRLSEGFRWWVKQCPHNHYTGFRCWTWGFSLRHHSRMLQSLPVLTISYSITHHLHPLTLTHSSIPRAVDGTAFSRNKEGTKLRFLRNKVTCECGFEFTLICTALQYCVIHKK